MSHVARSRWAQSAATAAVRGRTIPSDGHTTDAALIESAAQLGAPATVFGRAERVVKAGHDLDLGPEMEEDAHH